MTAVLEVPLRRLAVYHLLNRVGLVEEQAGATSHPGMSRMPGLPAD